MGSSRTTNLSTRHRTLGSVASVVAGAFLVSACTSPAVPTERPVSETSFPPPAVEATPTAGAASLEPGPGIDPVSASNPGAAARAILAKCGIGDRIPIGMVTGMGMIASPRDLVHYVPLTGREPQLAESGPAWIVTVHADIPQAAGNEIWTDPTCVVTAEDFGWWATGPVTDMTTGKVKASTLQVQRPDRSIPPLAP